MSMNLGLSAVRLDQGRINLQTLNWDSTPSQLIPPGFSLTRASTGTYFDSAGLLQTSAINAARGTYRYNGSSWVFDGTIIEAAATNLVTDVRDMTTSNWTRGATITVAQTGTGADGSANACSRLTGGAVAATNRVSQTLVAAASTRTYGPLIRRVTGTGPILITQDGFTTTTDVSSQINSSGFTQVQISGSTLNATYGVQVSTAGDVILVDGNQFEAGSAATSTILSSGSRSADVLTAPVSGLLVDAQGFAAIGGRIIAQVSVADRSYLSTFDGAAGGAAIYQDTVGMAVYDGTAVRYFNSTTIATAPLAGATFKIATTWAGSLCNGAYNGLIGTPATFDGSMNFGATLQIGSNTAGAAGKVSMVLQSLRLGTRSVTSSELGVWTA